MHVDTKFLLMVRAGDTNNSLMFFLKKSVQWQLEHKKAIYQKPISYLFAKHAKYVTFYNNKTSMNNVFTIFISKMRRNSHENVSLCDHAT